MTMIRTCCRWLGALLFLAALAAVASLLASDLWSGLAFTARHVHLQALALIFAGASFIFLQLRRPAAPRDLAKGILLGVAFVVWGAEQFLSPGPGVVACDCVVVTIFILDLGLVIAGQLAPPAPR